MSGIAFPDINPVAIDLGVIQIRWYALAYLSGFIGGWLYGGWLADLDRDRRHTRVDIDNILPWLVLGVIGGGRIGYVLFYNLGYYMDNPLSALYIWEGGMSFHGGLLGVATAIISYSLYHKFHPYALGDIVSAVVPIGLFFGRLANFANGELYGRPTTVEWAVVFPHDPAQVPRHPSQLYEAGLEGLVLGIVLFLLARIPAVRRTEGMLFGSLLIGYGLARLIIEFFREPDTQLGLYLDYFSMGQILCIPMLIAGGVIICHARRRAAAAAKA
ncbi:MAG: prolipoprotein diacylglyceryl transferase [Alphaproteobacteria bacterium]